MQFPSTADRKRGAPVVKKGRSGEKKKVEQENKRARQASA